jgi:hypothetical protein
MKTGFRGLKSGIHDADAALVPGDTFVKRSEAGLSGARDLNEAGD